MGTVKAVPLENGPIRRRLSIALLNGPEPKGPIGQLLELLRANNIVKGLISEPVPTDSAEPKMLLTRNGKAGKARERFAG